MPRHQKAGPAISPSNGRKPADAAPAPPKVFRDQLEVVLVKQLFGLDAKKN